MSGLRYHIAEARRCLVLARAEWERDAWDGQVTAITAARNAGLHLACAVTLEECTDTPSGYCLQETASEMALCTGLTQWLLEECMEAYGRMRAAIEAA